MEELIEKVDNLINELDNTKQVKDVKKALKEVNEDKNLQELLKEYEYNKTDSIKEQIIENELFQKYKEKEIDLNILIMEINKKLKTISKKGSCHK